MRIRKMISKIIVLIMCVFIISLSININTNAAEDKIITVNENMDINEYRRTKENTLTRKFNFDRASIYRESSKGEIINRIRLALNNLENNINLDSYIESFKSVNDYKIPMNYYFDTLNEYPEIFYPNLEVTCSYRYNTRTNEITSYNLIVTYQYESNTIYNMKNAFNKKVDEIKNNYLSKAKSNLEKEYIIHDYIIKNCRYDHENLSNLPTIDHTAYGSLVNGLAVCDGYSKGAKVLFDLCGIESGIVSSEKMNHAWNYVNINGQYYNLDVTWDDLDYYNYVDYSYFNISNKDMSSGNNPHIWDSSSYPSCISGSFNFLRNGKFYMRDGAELYTNEEVDGEDELYVINLDGSNGRIKYFEDINDDGKVDVIDLSIMAKNYNTIEGQANFDSRCDINMDGIVDIYDITKVSCKITN